MKTLCVCMGSACHLKDSQQIAVELERLLAEHGLTAAVRLKGSFCLGPCCEAVALRVGDWHLTHITLDNLETMFEQHILPRLAPK